MKHRKQVGFTLIELVIVITILGIVTVTAAPKFLNISSDARVAVLNGIAGSIKTINTIVNTKAIIQAVPDTGDDKNRTIATNLGPVILGINIQKVWLRMAKDWELQSSLSLKGTILISLMKIRVMRNAIRLKWVITKQPAT
ncbi:type II secretion system protein [Photobacterium leiognathi]|uniref:type II secretion system protein n=1 Tax=Photobacterium leiognathi TaxID=553611 RepID=UPI0029816EA0|nr:type II secretion system protein [Photobacterium leiognathi]